MGRGGLMEAEAGNRVTMPDSSAGVSAAAEREVLGSAEQDLPHIALEQERVRHPEPGKELDDVAVLQDTLAAVRGAVRPMSQVLGIDDDVPGVVGRAHGNRPEEPEQRAVGANHPGQLGRHRARRRLVQVVEDVPAQHAVHALVVLAEPGLQELRKLVERSFALVPLEVGAQILHVDLAAELLAEERDVRANHRPEVDQDGSGVRAEAGDELLQRLARVRGLLEVRRGGSRQLLRRGRAAKAEAREEVRNVANPSIGRTGHRATLFARTPGSMSAADPGSGAQTSGLGAAGPGAGAADLVSAWGAGRGDSTFFCMSTLPRK